MAFGLMCRTIQSTNVKIGIWLPLSGCLSLFSISPIMTSLSDLVLAWLCTYLLFPFGQQFSGILLNFLGRCQQWQYLLSMESYGRRQVSPFFQYSGVHCVLVLLLGSHFFVIVVSTVMMQYICIPSLPGMRFSPHFITHTQRLFGSPEGCGALIVFWSLGSGLYWLLISSGS